MQMYHDHCLCLPGWHHYTNFNCTFVDWFINWHISFPRGRTTSNLKNKESEIVYRWNYVWSIWLISNWTIKQWFSILLSKLPNYSKNQTFPLLHSNCLRERPFNLKRGGGLWFFPKQNSDSQCCWKNILIMVEEKKNLIQSFCHIT